MALSATVLPPSSKQGATHGYAPDGLLVPLVNSEPDGGGGIASHDFDAIGTDRAGQGMNGTSTPGAISEHDEVPPSTPSWAMQRHPDAVALTRALEEIARTESTVDGSSVRSTTDTTPATLLALSLQDVAAIEGAEDGGGTLVSGYMHDLPLTSTRLDRNSDPSLEQSGTNTHRYNLHTNAHTISHNITTTHVHTANILTLSTSNSE